MIQEHVPDINGRMNRSKISIFMCFIYRSLKALWTYLRKRDVDVGDILERIKDLIIKTIIRYY